MNHYLVIFDRSHGEMLRFQRYDDRDQALDARFTAEREYRDQADIEIVVLGAISGDSLRRTHGRYFKNFQELAAGALAAGAQEA